MSQSALNPTAMRPHPTMFEPSYFSGFNRAEELIELLNSPELMGSTIQLTGLVKKNPESSTSILFGSFDCSRWPSFH